MTVGAILLAATEAMKLTEKVVDALHKDKSEKLREDWEHDKTQLAEAVERGDLDAIRRITARWADNGV